MFWILSKQVGKKEAKVWLRRNVCCAKISIYCPGLKNQKTATKYPNFAEVRIMVIGVFKNNNNNKSSCCQSSASSVDVEIAVRYNDMLIITITALYHYRSQSFGFLLV